MDDIRGQKKRRYVCEKHSDLFFATHERYQVRLPGRGVDANWQKKQVTAP
jgi:hypothetical protein